MAFNINAQVILDGPKKSNLNQVTKRISDGLNKSTTVKISVDAKSISSLNNLNKQLNGINATLSSVSSLAASVSKNVNNLGTTYKKSGLNANTFASGQQNVQKQTNASNQALQQQAGLLANLSKRIGSTAKTAIAFGLISRPIYDVQRAFASAASDAVSFQKEIVKISQVTGKSVGQLVELREDINRLSTSLGVAATELAETARIIAQTGKTAEETSVILEALSRSTLAPTFGKITDTTEGLVAALGQFNLRAEDSEAILGALNRVSKNFAVEAEDLVSVIRRTGGVFAQAAGDSRGTINALEELIAVFTAVRANTRESADTIAAGLRTIFSRIQRRGTIEFLENFGIQLTNLNGQFIGIFPAFDELSNKLGSLIKQGDALTLSAIAEELGGIRQIGKLLPAIANFEDARKALKEAEKGAAEGLGQDVAKGIDTLDNRLKRVGQSFNELVRTVFESDAFQKFSKSVLTISENLLKLGTSIVKFIEPILPVIAALGAVKLSRAVFGFAAGGGIGNVVGGVTGTTSAAANQQTAAASQQTAAATATQNQLITKSNLLLENISTQLANFFSLQSADNDIRQAQLANLIQINNTGFNGLSKGFLSNLSSTITTSLNKFRRKSSGGPVLGFNKGGLVPGTGNRDTVPAVLTPGEFVIKKSSVESIGAGNLAAMNFNNGGKATAKGPKGRGNRAYVFDFDDTLGVSGSSGKELFSNDPALAASRQAKLRNAKATSLADAARKRSAQGFDVHVLTARFGTPGDEAALQDFLTKAGIKPGRTIFTGGLFKGEREPGKRPGTTRQLSTASKKARILEQLAAQYESILFLDDAIENVVKAKGVKGVTPIAVDKKTQGLRRKFQDAGEVTPLSIKEIAKGLNLNQSDPEFQKYKARDAEGQRLRLEATKEIQGKKQQRQLKKIEQAQFSKKFGISVLDGSFGNNKFNEPTIAQVRSARPTSGAKVLNEALARSDVQKKFPGGISTQQPKVVNRVGTSKRNLSDKGKNIFRDDVEAGIPLLFDKALSSFQDTELADVGSVPLNQLVSNSAISSISGNFFEAFARRLAGIVLEDNSGIDDVFDFRQVPSPEAKSILTELFGAFQLPNEFKNNDSSSNIASAYAKALTLVKPKDIEFFREGGSPEDTVPALLTPGEFVFNKKAASRIGFGNLNRMNKKGVQGFNQGGPVGFQSGGTVSSLSSGSGGPSEVKKESIARKILNKLLKRGNKEQKENNKAIEEESQARQGLDFGALSGALISLQFAASDLGRLFSGEVDSLGDVFSTLISVGTTLALTLQAINFQQIAQGFTSLVDTFSPSNVAGYAGVLKNLFSDFSNLGKKAKSPDLGTLFKDLFKRGGVKRVFAELTSRRGKATTLGDISRRALTRGAAAGGKIGGFESLLGKGIGKLAKTTEKLDNVLVRFGRNISKVGTQFKRRGGGGVTRQVVGKGLQFGGQALAKGTLQAAAAAIVAPLAVAIGIAITAIPLGNFLGKAFGKAIDEGIFGQKQKIGRFEGREGQSAGGAAVSGAITSGLQGTGLGAGIGAAIGGAIGAAGGPIGAAVGAAIGAVIGAGAGVILGAINGPLQQASFQAAKEFVDAQSKVADAFAAVEEEFTFTEFDAFLDTLTQKSIAQNNLIDTYTKQLEQQVSALDVLALLNGPVTALLNFGGTVKVVNGLFGSLIGVLGSIGTPDAEEGQVRGVGGFERFFIALEDSAVSAIKSSTPTGVRRLQKQFANSPLGKQLITAANSGIASIKSQFDAFAQNIGLDEFSLQALGKFLDQEIRREVDTFVQSIEETFPALGSTISDTVNFAIEQFTAPNKGLQALGGTGFIIEDTLSVVDTLFGTALSSANSTRKKLAESFAAVAEIINPEDVKKAREGLTIGIGQLIEAGQLDVSGVDIAGEEQRDLKLRRTEAQKELDTLDPGEFETTSEFRKKQKELQDEIKNIDTNIGDANPGVQVLKALEEQAETASGETKKRLQATLDNVNNNFNDALSVRVKTAQERIGELERAKKDSGLTKEEKAELQKQKDTVAGLSEFQSTLRTSGKTISDLSDEEIRTLAERQNKSEEATDAIVKSVKAERDRATAALSGAALQAQANRLLKEANVALSTFKKELSESADRLAFANAQAAASIANFAAEADSLSGGGFSAPELVSGFDFGKAGTNARQDFFNRVETEQGIATGNIRNFESVITNADEIGQNVLKSLGGGNASAKDASNAFVSEIEKELGGQKLGPELSASIQKSLEGQLLKRQGSTGNVTADLKAFLEEGGDLGELLGPQFKAIQDQFKVLDEAAQEIRANTITYLQNLEATRNQELEVRQRLTSGLAKVAEAQRFGLDPEARDVGLFGADRDIAQKGIDDQLQDLATAGFSREEGAAFDITDTSLSGLTSQFEALQEQLKANKGVTDAELKERELLTSKLQRTRQAIELLGTETSRVAAIEKQAAAVVKKRAEAEAFAGKFVLASLQGDQKPLRDFEDAANATADALAGVKFAGGKLDLSGVSQEAQQELFVQSQQNPQFAAAAAGVIQAQVQDQLAAGEITQEEAEKLGALSPQALTREFQARQLEEQADAVGADTPAGKALKAQAQNLRASKTLEELAKERNQLLQEQVNALNTLGTNQSQQLRESGEGQLRAIQNQQAQLNAETSNLNDLLASPPTEQPVDQRAFERESAAALSPEEIASLNASVQAAATPDVRRVAQGQLTDSQRQQLGELGPAGNIKIDTEQLQPTVQSFNDAVAKFGEFEEKLASISDRLPEKIVVSMDEPIRVADQTANSQVIAQEILASLGPSLRNIIENTNSYQGAPDPGAINRNLS